MEIFANVTGMFFDQWIINCVATGLLRDARAARVCVMGGECLDSNRNRRRRKFNISDPSQSPNCTDLRFCDVMLVPLTYQARDVHLKKAGP